MSASFNTVEAIYNAVRKHVTDKQMEEIIDELLQIPGNKSFRETTERLAHHQEFGVDHGSTVQNARAKRDGC